MEAFASTDSAQVSHVVIDLVYPNTGSANSSASAFPTATSLSSTSGSASYITSSSPEPSTLMTVFTSSPSSESTSATTTVSPKSTTTHFVDPRTPPASSTSYDLSSSSTESSIATFVPAAPPSNAHIARLAEIILPSVVGGAGIGAGVGTALWKLFGKLADAASVARALKQAQRVELLDRITARQEAWNTYIERRVLMEEGRNPGILTTDQVNKIRAVENGGESIWNSNVRSLAALGTEKAINQL